MPTSHSTLPNYSSIYYVNRIEPATESLQLEDTVGAQVHDALWMLAQQWRVGEFKNTDGGSAIKAKIKIESNSINKYQLKDFSIKSFNNNIPLNTLIEAVEFTPDLLTRIQTAKHWFKLLKKKIIDSNDFNTIKTNLLDSSSILIEDSSSTDYAGLSDRKYQQLLKISKNGLDGAKLYLDLKSKRPNLDTGYESNASIDANTKLNAIADEFINYIERVYIHNSETAWDSKSLEYRFKVASHNGTSETVLQGDNYQSGHIQWYDMDIVDNTSMGSSASNQEYTEEFIPTPIEFKGMPVERWWELEDRNIDYASMLTGTNDLSKLMIMDFGLTYSNDWFVIPKTLNVGTISTIKALVVTDVFGKHTLIEASGRGDGMSWQRWSMFTLNERGTQADAADNRLFIPPSVVTNIESEPIEQIYFVRDEMANLVWGLEEIVPSNLYGGKRGSIAANELEKYLKENEVYTPPNINGLIVNEAELNYELMNTVPENWIPFIPAKKTGSDREIQFQRAKMPRKINGFVTTDFVSSRTPLLTSTNPYYIDEEEIVSVGKQVKATFQRARWTNGEIYTWLGYTTTNGRGEADSGLEFDRLTPKE